MTLTLRQLDPHLGHDAGYVALGLGSAQRPLLLILDDPNRTDRPGAILRRIFGWSRNLVSEQPERRRHVKVIVPVWESQFSNIQHGIEDEKWFTALSVGPMLRGESVMCLRKGLSDNRAGLSDPQLSRIADRLRDDPILLSIYARLLSTNPTLDVNHVVADVIGKFISAEFAELASATNQLQASYQTALIELTRQMIVRKRFHPEWQEVKSWLDSDAVSALQDIATRGTICHVVNQGKRDTFEFRHDRILEWQLAETITREFSQNPRGLDALFDPYMVPVLGHAVANQQFPDASLDRIAECLPACLVAALPFIPAGNVPCSLRICRRVAKWLGSIHVEPPSVQDDALSMLQDTQSEHVLHVTKDLPPTLPILFARLRNGDGMSGAKVLSGDFYPSTNFSWLENLISQAAFLHGGRLIDQLIEILQAPSIDDDLRRGGLVLAGYLADPALADAILVCWHAAIHEDKLIKAALWAALRCSDPSGNLLAAILPALFLVSDELDAGHSSARSWLFRDLGSSARHGISDEILFFLKDLAERDNQYEPFVFSLFARIDKPVCLEFLIKKVARRAAEPVKPGHISSVFIWEHQWRRMSGLDNAPMPTECVDTLWNLCQPANPGWLRTYAFKLWVRYCGDRLRSTDLPVDLTNSETAFWELAKRGDPRVADQLLQKVRESPNYFHAFGSMWSDGFESVLGEALKRGEAVAIQTLREIPTDVAERLVITNWKTIKDQPFGVAAALYVARNSTLDLARTALESDSEPANILRHTGDYFGFFVQGYSEKITPKHLDAIRPYLALLDDHDLAHIAQFCAQYGYIAWAEENLLDICRERSAQGHGVVLSSAMRQWLPSDEELIADLDRIVTAETRRAEFEVQLWADQFNERSDDPTRMPRLVSEWLEKEASPIKFKMAALAIRRQGSRSSLQVLSRFSTRADWRLLERAYRDAEYGVMRRSLV